MATPKSVASGLQPWIEARRELRLPHAVIQMARELGLNPKKLGSLNNHHQERWKQPLPQFIATLYAERFGKDVPDTVRSIEDTVAMKLAKKQARRTAKAAAKPTSATGQSV
jgi:hypothetical protein